MGKWVLKNKLIIALIFFLIILMMQCFKIEDLKDEVGELKYCISDLKSSLYNLNITDKTESPIYNTSYDFEGYNRENFTYKINISAELKEVKNNTTCFVKTDKGEYNLNLDGNKISGIIEIPLKEDFTEISIVVKDNDGEKYNEIYNSHGESNRYIDDILNDIITLGVEGNINIKGGGSSVTLNVVGENKFKSIEGVINSGDEIVYKEKIIDSFSYKGNLSKNHNISINLLCRDEYNNEYTMLLYTKAGDGKFKNHKDISIMPVLTSIVTSKGEEVYKNSLLDDMNYNTSINYNSDYYKVNIKIFTNE